MKLGYMHRESLDAGSNIAIWYPRNTYVALQAVV